MSDTRGSDKSSERVFAILEMFERERRPLSLKELSEYCRIPTSTCHALVHVLLNRSYLYQTGHRKSLYPTRKLYDLGATILAHDPLLQRLLPFLEELRDTTRETVILGKRQKDSIIYLEVQESPQTIRYSASVGDTKPLHSTCIGKTILSSWSPAEIREWLEQHPPEKVTDHTITSYADLMEDLEEGKRLGYFTTRGENVPDVTALAVPLSVNQEQLGLAIAGPTHRLVDATFDKAVKALRDTLEQLHAQGISDNI